MSTLERSRLTQARTLAMRRHDYDEVKDIDTQLAAAESIPVPARVEAVDVLAKVNERNRKANQEAVRRAEMAESERKRRERKLVAAGGTLTPQDPSARLKTVPRLFNAATPTSRFVPFLFSSFCYVVVLATRVVCSVRLFHVAFPLLGRELLWRMARRARLRHNLHQDLWPRQQCPPKASRRPCWTRLRLTWGTFKLLRRLCIPVEI